MHGDCKSPRVIEMRGVEMLIRKQLATITEDPFVDWYDEGGKTLFVPGRAPYEPERPKVHTVWAKVRCRRCKPCLWHKRRQWTAKAIAEVRMSHRTWFGTLTCDGHRRTWARFAAEKWANTARAEPFSRMSEADRTTALAKFISPEVTRWLKRVRKNSGQSFRYLLVVEAHADGFPHYHILLHEPSSPVTKRELQGAWTWGFSQFKLLDPGDIGGVRYACKYLTKAAQTRVRASRQYGQFRGTKRKTELLNDATKEEGGVRPPAYPEGKEGEGP